MAEQYNAASLDDFADDAEHRAIVCRACRACLQPILYLFIGLSFTIHDFLLFCEDTWVREGKVSGEEQ